MKILQNGVCGFTTEVFKGKAVFNDIIQGFHAPTQVVNFFESGGRIAFFIQQRGDENFQLAGRKANGHKTNRDGER